MSSAWMPHLRAMTMRDLSAVLAIEEQQFGDDAWPRSFFMRDLANTQAVYLVLELIDESAGPAAPQLAGYAGYWLLEDEANLMNIAIASAWQRQGWGEYLLREVLVRMALAGAQLCTLEVRVSNLPAQALYRKLGFEATGRRRRYYQNNGEDALLMANAALCEGKIPVWP